MAKKSGVWNLQQVRDKSLQSLWDYDTYAVEGSGELFTWGRNATGGLAQNNINAPSANGLSSPVQVPGTTWKYVAGGSNPGGTDSVIATKSDGTLWAWADNDFGQLGLNSNVQYSSPVQVGSDTTWAYPNSASSTKQCGAVKTDGTLWIWGENEYGTLGQNNTTDYSSPVQVGSDTTWSTDINMFAMRSHGCYAIKTDGTLWTWGAGSNGGLGHNNDTNYSSPTQIGSDTDWKALSGGGYQGSMGLLKTDGTRWVTGGWNRYGWFGDGNDDQKISSPVQVSSDSDWEWLSGNAGRRTDGTIWIWGGNTYGQCAQNDSNSGYSSPVQLPGTDWHKTDFGSGYGIRTDGTFWIWGRNYAGQLGLNQAGDSNNNSRSSPVQISGTGYIRWGGGNMKTFLIKEA